MTDFTPSESNATATSRRYLPWLLLLFVGSGCAALIYEIVWFQMLQLVIGSTAVSLGVLLGTFMGGMCLGSLILPRLLASRRRPLRVYAMLELGIGIIGLIILVAMPTVSRVYLNVAGHGLVGILLRAVVCAVCLLPPTLLMGATLPAIARWLETTPQGVSWLGFFYGGNIAGAVFGCLLAGFYLLPEHNLAIATYAAVGINFCVAVLGLGLDGQLPPTPVDTHEPAPATAPSDDIKLVHVAIALSGLSALGAEVVWTRLLSLLVGGTAYAFSIILAVFLIGLGIGSSVGSWCGRLTARPRVALGVCQMALAFAIAWSAYMIANSLPYWPIDPRLADSPWFVFQLDLARCLWAVLPPSLLWGASFPIALAAVARPGQDPGRLVGGVYAANTLGAILGALWFSLVLIPWKGTQVAEQMLIIVAIVAALVVLVPVLVRAAQSKVSGFPVMGAVSLLLAVGLAVFFVCKVSKIPDGLIEYGRYFISNARDKTLGQTKYIGEGMNSSVAVTTDTDGYLNFHVSGKVEASAQPQDMRLQRMLGHIPALLEGNPKTVLVVGCGAGVTAGTFLTYPSVQRVVICEIEPLIPRMVTPFFTEYNYGIVDGIAKQNPHTVLGKQVEVVYDDGRHFLLTTKEKFDIITSDPIHPWVKGSAVLYTKEYFQLCLDHLKPGGMVTQWVPLYESTRAAVQSEFKTFFAVFPEATVWSNDYQSDGYDVLMLGEQNPALIDIETLQARLDDPAFGPVVQSLSDVGFTSAYDLFATYGGQSSDLEPWLREAEINRDIDLRLQYLAGLGSDHYDEVSIYNEMKPYRVLTEDLFTDTPSSRKLRSILMREAVTPPPPPVTSVRP